MKILFVSPEVPTSGGAGIATYISEATKSLDDAGHECHVLTWSESITDMQHSAQYKYTLHVCPVDFRRSEMCRVDVDLLASATIAEAILTLHREYNFQIIEGTDWCAPLYCLLQRRCVEPSLRETLITIFNHGTTFNIARHESTFIPRSTFHRINLEHQALRLADKVICPSGHARSNLIKLEGIDPDKVVVIPEPLGLSAKRPEFPIQFNNIIYYGSVVISKGLKPFIEVARKFLQLRPFVGIQFLGPIHPLGETESELQSKILKKFSSSKNQVEFLGKMPRALALEFIGPQHIMINMSPRETFCYAFAEGIMSGALPIALSNSPQSEFLPPYLRKRYCTSPDLAAISEFDIEDIFNNFEDEREQIIEYAQKLTSPAIFAGAYEELLSAIRKSFTPAKRHIPSDAAVTVLIPAHNPKSYLLETIQSVQQQSEKAAKIIVGDDGSDDQDSQKIIEQVKQYDNVRVLHLDWRGLAETRNRLLQACETPLFSFVDADDLLSRNFVSVSRRYLMSEHARNVKSVQGWYQLFGEETGVRAPVVYQHFSHYVWNDLKNNHTGFTETFRDLRYHSGLVEGEAEDWEFWLRYFRAGYEVRIVPQVLWSYRRHPQALSASWSEVMSVGTARANARVLRDYLMSSGTASDHVWDFIGDYMYLGETFFSGLEKADQLLGSKSANNSLKKIESRMMQFQRSTRRPNLKQRVSLRLMRTLSKGLRTQ